MTKQTMLTRDEVGIATVDGEPFLPGDRVAPCRGCLLKFARKKIVH